MAAESIECLLQSAYRPGQFDITWDDPRILTANQDWQILGVNLWRSFDSEFGPFDRVNNEPIGAEFWRDETNGVVTEEDVSNSFIARGEAGGGQGGQRFVFRVLRWPIVKEASQAVPANHPRDVKVFVDGVEARVYRVFGETGEVELDTHYYLDPATQQNITPVLPGPSSQVTCHYRYTKQLVRTDLQQRIFWRVTTVGVFHGCPNPTVDDLVETPLEHASATSNSEIEKLDYIWREAIRRNRWILEQGGEPVKVFLRKNVGIPCGCVDFVHKQPLSDDMVCFGTGIVDGYEGPYDILLAPDDAERRIAQKDVGRTVEHSYEVWTGATPILSQRDFLVKIDGDRYSVGAVRRPSNKGNVLQQHFTIGHIDEKDIRFQVPVGPSIKFAATQIAPHGPELSAAAEPTDKPNIPEERQLRGRTKNWSNKMY